MAKIKCPACGTKYKGKFCPNCSEPAPEQPAKKSKLPVILGILAVILVIGIIGGGDETEPKKPSGVTPDSSTVKQEESAAVDAEEVVEEEAAPEVTLAETEIYNKDGVTVTATGIDLKGVFGPEIKFVLKNETDRNIQVSTDSVSVNGFMTDLSGLYSDVAAGKSANEGMSLMNSDLREAGVETVADVAFTLRISDSDTYDTIDETGLITVSTSAAGTFEQAVDTSGDVVYDKDGVKVICKGLTENTIWDGAVVFLIQNTSERDVLVSSENVSINDVMVDDALWSDLRAGTNAVDAMYILDIDEIDLEDLDAVEKIEFAITVRDTNDWSKQDKSDPIVLNFESAEAE